MLSHCDVVIPNDGQAPVDTYRRHEIAHCNGWPANHPHDDAALVVTADLVRTRLRRNHIRQLGLEGAKRLGLA